MSELKDTITETIQNETHRKEMGGKENPANQCTVRQVCQPDIHVTQFRKEGRQKGVQKT